MTPDTEHDPSAEIAPSDQDQIRQLGLLYAHALDNNVPEILAKVFTPDATWTNGVDQRAGIEELKLIPGRLAARWTSTMHNIHNQLVFAAAGNVEAETYCSAEHFDLQPDGSGTLYSVSIRYRDRLVRTAGGWRIAHRALYVPWTQTHDAATWSTPMMSTFGDDD